MSKIVTQQPVTPETEIMLERFPEFKLSMGKKRGEAGYNVKFDYNTDGQVNLTDFLQFVEGEGGVAPPAGPAPVEPPTKTQSLLDKLDQNTSLTESEKSQLSTLISAGDEIQDFDDLDTFITSTIRNRVQQTDQDQVAPGPPTSIEDFDWSATSPSVKDYFAEELRAGRLQLPGIQNLLSGEVDLEQWLRTVPGHEMYPGQRRELANTLPGATFDRGPVIDTPPTEPYVEPEAPPPTPTPTPLEITEPYVVPDPEIIGTPERTVALKDILDAHKADPSGEAFKALRGAANANAGFSIRDQDTIGTKANPVTGTDIALAQEQGPEHLKKLSEVAHQNAVFAGEKEQGDAPLLGEPPPTKKIADDEEEDSGLGSVGEGDPGVEVLLDEEGEAITQKTWEDATTPEEAYELGGFDGYVKWAERRDKTHPYVTPPANGAVNGAVNGAENGTAIARTELDQPPIDAVTQANLARFDQQADDIREQTLIRLNRMGLATDALSGDAADVLAKLEGQLAIGRKDVLARGRERVEGFEWEKEKEETRKGEFTKTFDENVRQTKALEKLREDVYSAKNLKDFFDSVISGLTAFGILDPTKGNVIDRVKDVFTREDDGSGAPPTSGTQGDGSGAFPTSGTREVAEYSVDQMVDMLSNKGTSLDAVYDILEQRGRDEKSGEAAITSAKDFLISQGVTSEESENIVNSILFGPQNLPLTADGLLDVSSPVVKNTSWYKFLEGSQVKPSDADIQQAYSKMLTAGETPYQFGKRLKAAQNAVAAGDIAAWLASALIPGKTGEVLSDIATWAGRGAAIGSFIPVIGPWVGAFVGGTYGGIKSVGPINKARFIPFNPVEQFIETAHTLPKDELQGRITDIQNALVRYPDNPVLQQMLKIAEMALSMEPGKTPVLPEQGV